MKKSHLIYIVLIVQLLGCGAVLSALPIVISAVVEAGMVLDSIERFVDHFFVAVPDTDREQKVRDALEKARIALNVALRTTQGVEELSREDVIKAFKAFQEAYEQLLVLVEPMGVKQISADKKMSVSSDQLLVPKPLAMEIGQ